MSQKQQVYSKVDLLLHSTFADKIHCNCFGRWVRCEEQAVKWLLRGRSGSQCGSYTLSVGHIHLVWVIHTRVSNIHSVLVTYTRCWSYTLGGDHIHFVWVIHTWCQSYTLGVGHIHLVLVRYTQWVWFIYTRVCLIHMLGLVYIHSVLVTHTRCWSYTHDVSHIHWVAQKSLTRSSEEISCIGAPATCMHCP